MPVYVLRNVKIQRVKSIKDENHRTGVFCGFLAHSA